MTGPNAAKAAPRSGGGNIWRGLGILKAGGLSDQVCAYGLDALALFVTATAVEDSLLVNGVGWTDITRAEHVTRVRAYFASLPPASFPHITGMVEALTRDEGDERFEFGLDLLVSGLARHAAG